MSSLQRVLLGLYCAAICVAATAGSEVEERLFERPAGTAALDAKIRDIYDHSMTDIHGSKVDLGKHRTQVLLLVNVASEDVRTQEEYGGLQTLHDMFSEDGLKIMAFPSNNFNHAEIGTNQEIHEFVTQHLGVDGFPLFAKSDVVGKNSNPVFKHLRTMFGGRDINANFEKFLIVDGAPVKRYPAEVRTVELQEDIEDALQGRTVKKSLRNVIHSKTTHDGNPTPEELAVYDTLNNPSEEELLAQDPSGGRGKFGEDLDKPYGGWEEEDTYLEGELKRGIELNEAEMQEQKQKGEITELDVAKMRATMKTQYKAAMREEKRRVEKRDKENEIAHKVANGELAEDEDDEETDEV